MWRSQATKSKMFRTSVYFARVVHDKLRDIAHEERKSVAGVIHDALDDFPRKRGFPTTEELKRQ